MNESGNDSRIQKMVNNILDTAFEELEKLGIEGVVAGLQEFKTLFVKKYQELKALPNNNSGITLEELDRQIALSEVSEESGRINKEFDVRRAMKELGYSEEDVRQVLDLARSYEK